jgi:hypothetical protein
MLHAVFWRVRAVTELDIWVDALLTSFELKPIRRFMFIFDSG